MSPQYTSVHPTFNIDFRIPSTKARKIQQMQKEDPQYRHFDRMLTRAYIELRKKRKAALQQQAEFLAPWYDTVLTSLRYRPLTLMSEWTSATTQRIRTSLLC